MQHKHTKQENKVKIYNMLILKKLNNFDVG